MQLIHTIAALRPALEQKSAVVLVPTMGNLHAGHLSLLRLARERAGTVVASIFVNRLQFSPQEDFAEYPRTLERDCQLLADHGCDIVFAPTEEEIYPEDQGYRIHPQPELKENGAVDFLQAFPQYLKVRNDRHLEQYTLFACAVPLPRRLGRVLV